MLLGALEQGQFGTNLALDFLFEAPCLPGCLGLLACGELQPHVDCIGPLTLV